MTRTRQARIALWLLALANAAYVVASWPRSSRLTEIGTLVVCAGALVLAYREDPASFHRPVRGRQATCMILAPVLLVAAAVLLGATHVI